MWKTSKKGMKGNFSFETKGFDSGSTVIGVHYNLLKIFLFIMIPSYKQKFRYLPDQMNDLPQNLSRWKHLTMQLGLNNHTFPYKLIINYQNTRNNILPVSPLEDIFFYHYKKLILSIKNVKNMYKDHQTGS